MDFDLIPNTAPEAAANSAISVGDETLSLLAEKAFERLSFTFTETHLKHMLDAAADSRSSENDRFVCSFLLKNAIIAARGELPLCQDTGTAQIFAWKDEGVLSTGDPYAALERGAKKTWADRNLRNSTNLPLSLFEETDPGDNMPAQIALFAGRGAEKSSVNPAWHFLFCAKGGGSSNKTQLFQATKALLEPKAFDAFLSRQVPALGTSACPPYTVSVVVGGLSPEQNLTALKLATAGFFDADSPVPDRQVFGFSPQRCPDWENRVMEIAQGCGLGAQFGGRAFASGAVVLRLPRHGASCPVSIGVSCSAHRNLFGRIDSEGAWLQTTVDNPLSIPGLKEAAALCEKPAESAVDIDMDKGIPHMQDKLRALPPGTPVLLTGTLLVARDAAHARWRALIRSGEPLPSYIGLHPILYAGPAKTPEGKPTGSFGPTTAGRMDEYAEELMSRGAALVTLAKGNRSETWRSACRQWGGTYLGTVGGGAALLAEEHIRSSEIVDYPELGMEAVRKIVVEKMPAFVLINDSGEDFYAPRPT